MAGDNPSPLSPPTGEVLRGAERTTYVRGLFERVAPRYDLMNRLMTAGLDLRWRRIAIAEARLPSGGRLLDLATGTGDIARMALERDPSLHVTGADFSLAMMCIGRKRSGDYQIGWCGADALQLPFQDNTFDAVISAYLIRNLSPDRIEMAFREQTRLVKPGGWVVCLDATPPPQTPLKPLILLYLNQIIPMVGGLLAGNRNAYTYLPRSTQAFKTPDELAALMGTAGLREVRYQRFMLGVMSLLVGLKPERVMSDG
jgi:demethylmenaquinone methyltransferase/2-methoxy-6-polyprenyl-1,4-benzoquinol methylase